MVKLFDTHKRYLGDITETQLQFLIDSMEEESTTDQDYYLEAATLEYLEARGADQGLILQLRRYLGDHEGLTIRWTRE